MQELWDAILRYLAICNRGDSNPHRLMILSRPGGVLYAVLDDDGICYENSDLERVAVWLKTYTSWEEDRPTPR